MNNLQKLNTIAISTPIIIALFAIFETGFLLLALLSTMITGLIQIIIAFIIFFQSRNRNKHIITYLSIVIIFFGLVYNFSNYIFEYEMINYIWILPVFLCMYLTYIVHLN